MEMAVRLSIGAARRQLIAQLLAESLLLAMLGGVGGLVVAHWTLAGIAAMLPSQRRRDARLLAQRPGRWCSRRSLSMAPACCSGSSRRCTARGPISCPSCATTRASSRASRGAARFRTSLVTAQIALSMALLVSAGLFTKSLLNVSRVDLGVKIDNVVTFGDLAGAERLRLDAGAALYRPDRGRARRAARRDRRDGVRRCRCSPGNNWGEGVAVEGFKTGPTPTTARASTRSARTTSTLGMPLLAGRDFTARRRRRAEGRDRQRGVREEVQPRAQRRRQADVDGQRLARHRDRRTGEEREVQRGQGRDPAGLRPAVPASGRVDRTQLSTCDRRSRPCRSCARSRRR